MKKIICSNKVAEAVGPYSQAVETDNLIFISGQLPIDKVTGTMPEGIVEQTKTSLNNIKYILQEAGLDMENVVKTTVYLQHISDFGAMNEVYGSYFTNDYPARVAFEVVALPKGALVEIEAIATK